MFSGFALFTPVATAGALPCAASIIRHNGTAYGRNAYRSALYAEFVYNFRNKAVNYAVRTAGAIMERRVRQRFRFVKYYHYSAPPFLSALSIASSIMSADGIIPPARLQRRTGFLHFVAS